MLFKIEMSKLNSHNEWDTLKEVIVGTAKKVRQLLRGEKITI